MTAEEGRWDEVEGDNPEQYYNRSELEQARARMEAEKHMLDQEEDLFKTSDIGFDYQEGGEQEAGEYDPIGEPDIFDTDGQKFIDMFGEPEEAEEDVSVGGPPAGDTIPANGLYIDDEEEIPAEESKATEEQIGSDTYYYDYSDYWKKGDAYQRSGLALQAGISTDLANSEWDDLPSQLIWLTRNGMIYHPMHKQR